MEKNILDKLKELFGSIRFWQVSSATSFVLLGHYFPDAQFLWNTLAAWLAAVASIGTLDSVASRISGDKTDLKEE